MVPLRQDAAVQTSFDDRLGYHIVRRVTPPESPFAGLLARDDAGTTALLVGVDAPNGWPSAAGWSDAEHVIAPFDVIAAPTGNEVVLPWCTEPLEAFLERRRLSGQEFTAGEAVTLGVSILRGARDVVAADGPGDGEWWLTGDGRPMFVPRPGVRAAVHRESVHRDAAGDPRTARDRHTAVDPHTSALEATAHSTRDRGIQQIVRQGAAHVTAAAGSCERAMAPGRWAAAVGAALDAAEDQLFATASPAALELRSLRPRVARSLSSSEFDRALLGEASPGDASGVVSQRPAGPGRRIWGFATTQLNDAAARHIDPEIADVAAQTWRRTRERVVAVLRKPVLVGLFLAVLVVGVGVLWPAEGDSDNKGSAGVAASASPAPDAPPETAVPLATAPATAPSESPAAAPALEGMAQVASALLVERESCGDEIGCAERVYENADAAERVALPVADASVVRAIDDAAGRSVALVDDLGGVAVLRVEVAGSTAEMLIIVQTERGWRIRDVFDVLDAPPTGGS